MSRPPRPPFRVSTAADGASFAEPRWQFLPVEFLEMVELQRTLAELESRLGTTRNEKDARGTAASTGDFALTLMELSALVAHTLGLHQNLYAREAFLGTAETGRSLVLHARRLAYEPDQGLAASGYAVLTVEAGLTGTVPEGFALASSAKGETKAQTFETLDDYDVDAKRNEGRPVARTRPGTMTFVSGKATFRLQGAALNLVDGEYGILIRQSDNTWHPVSIVTTTPNAAADETAVEVQLLNPASALAAATQDLATLTGAPRFRFLAMPAERLHRFGWDADPVRFPPSSVENNGAYPLNPLLSLPDPDFGYTVTRDDGAGHHTLDVYLSELTDTNLVDSLVVVLRNNVIQALKVVEQRSASVAFRRGENYSFPVITVNNGVASSTTQTKTLESDINGTVSCVRLQTSTGAFVTRASIAVQAFIHAGWQFDAPVVPTEPNPTAVAAPLEVDVNFGEFRPGDAAVFETLDGAFSQVVAIQSYTITPTGTTVLFWAEVTDPPPGGWRLDNLRVFGNVVRITHGETQSEVLGGSDGVTMFQRFELKKAPLTHAPGGGGGEPEIEIRVNDVEWTRVDDFFASRPHDRHYRLEFDESQKAWVIFGNGLYGAIPPSGKKHIRAIYRHGLGVAGNADARAVRRIKKAHPLIATAVNPTAIAGGADAAGTDDLKRQATRFIRTFDRAVSVQDHADLALLYPGVARSAARTAAGGGIEVVVATAEGGAPPLADVQKFLDARRDTMRRLEVVGPEPVDIYLDLVIQHDPALLTENVKRGVQNAFVGAADDDRAPGMFTFAARDFGQPAHLSEVYDRAADVEGVTFVDVTRFRLDPLATGVADVLQVNARQWLRLLPANLSISIVPESAA